MGELHQLLPELNGIQRDLITELFASGGMSGREAIDALEEKYHGVDISHGRAYPALDKLVRLGLVNKGARDRRTNEYKLTVSGSVMNGILKNA